MWHVQEIERIAGQLASDLLRAIEFNTEERESGNLALLRIRLLHHVSKAINEHLSTSVAVARSEGATWQQVANALGLIHASSAEKRYGKGRERERLRQQAIRARNQSRAD